MNNSLYINDTIVENVAIDKYVGSLIDNKIVFTKNIDNVYTYNL